MARLAPKVLNLNESDACGGLRLRSELQQLINRHNTAQQLVQHGANKHTISNSARAWNTIILTFDFWLLTFDFRLAVLAHF
ncbi:hypothetical protein [Nostoc sp.]